MTSGATLCRLGRMHAHRSRPGADKIAPVPANCRRLRSAGHLLHIPRPHEPLVLQSSAHPPLPRNGLLMPTAFVLALIWARNTDREDLGLFFEMTVLAKLLVLAYSLVSVGEVMLAIAIRAPGIQERFDSALSRFNHRNLPLDISSQGEEELSSQDAVDIDRRLQAFTAVQPSWKAPSSAGAI